MTTDATQAPLLPEPIAEPEEALASDIIREINEMNSAEPETTALTTEVAELNAAEGVSSTVEATYAPTEPQEPQIPASPKDSVPEQVLQSPAISQPVDVAGMQRQIADYQQQLETIRQVEQQRQTEIDGQQYRQQLENQGYAPEHAQQTAVIVQQARQRELQAVQQAQSYEQHLKGKTNAAMHFAKKYDVEPQALMQHETPEGMESAASMQARLREQDIKIAKLTKNSVPSQSFDNNQASPSASSSEARLLEGYISLPPDQRTPEMNAAGRRAAGL